MSNIKHNNRKLICSSCAIIFFCAFGANADISLPAPDNAALLYYQAMLLRPDFGDTYTSIKNVLRGNDPNEMVREYLDLRECRKAISLAEAATNILDCSWGIIRYQGNDLLIEWRNLAYLLEVDARTLAFDGQYRAALERCLSIQRFARHFNDEGFLGYAVSMPIESHSLSCVRYILGLMPPDRDPLIWLQSQISSVQGAPPTPAIALEIEMNDYLQWLSEDPNTIEWLRQNNSEKVEDESTRQEILNLTDKEVLELIKELNNWFLSSVNRIVGSDMTYQHKYSELKELQEELINPPIIDPYYHLWTSLPRNLTGQHDIYVQGITVFNATRSTIEIYLIKAETGHLPETLPADLPKDPFSGQDFGYDVTNKGFTISFDPEDIGDLRIRQLEFTVAQ